MPEAKKKTHADQVFELLKEAGAAGLTHTEIAAKMNMKSLPAIYPAIAKLLADKKVKRRELKEADNGKKERRLGSWLYHI